MPKLDNTRAQRLQKLLAMLESGPAFSDIGQPAFTPADAAEQFRRWSQTWIIAELRELLARDLRPRQWTAPSGERGWCDYLRNVYGSFADFEAYAETYGLLARLGYDSAEQAWAENPLVHGSTNPADYGRHQG